MKSQGVARKIDVDVLQVVLTRATNADEALRHLRAQKRTASSAAAIMPAGSIWPERAAS